MRGESITLCVSHALARLLSSANTSDAPRSKTRPHVEGFGTAVLTAKKTGHFQKLGNLNSQKRTANSLCKRQQPHINADHGQSATYCRGLDRALEEMGIAYPSSPRQQSGSGCLQRKQHQRNAVADRDPPSLECLRRPVLLQRKREMFSDEPAAAAHHLDGRLIGVRRTTHQHRAVQ